LNSQRSNPSYSARREFILGGAASSALVLDAGSKTLSADPLLYSDRHGYGYVVEHPAGSTTPVA